MSGIVLPAGVKAPEAPKDLNFDDLTDEQRAAVEANAAKVSPEEATPKVLTAFAVIIEHDGSVSVDPSLIKGVQPDRSPSNNDILSALTNLQVEIQTNITALKTANLMVQQAQAAQQQYAAQQEHARIQSMLSRPAGRG